MQYCFLGLYLISDQILSEPKPSIHMRVVFFLKERWHSFITQFTDMPFGSIHLFLCIVCKESNYHLLGVTLWKKSFFPTNSSLLPRRKDIKVSYIMQEMNLFVFLGATKYSNWHATAETRTHFGTWNLFPRRKEKSHSSQTKNIYKGIF